MPVYMKLKSNGTTLVFALYDSKSEAQRVCAVLNALSDKWEFFCD